MAIIEAIGLLLQLAIALFVKTPEEKAEDAMTDRIKTRTRQALERHVAGTDFASGKTSSIERLVGRLLKM